MITMDLERLLFPNSGWLCSIISRVHGAINMKLKQIPGKLNVWRDGAVITKHTSQWDYSFPWAVLLYVIRCDILPPPRCSAAEWLKQPINHSVHPFHYHRWLLLLKPCDGFLMHVPSSNQKTQLLYILFSHVLSEQSSYSYIHTNVITLQQFGSPQWISK